jgi:5-methylcytosine-specific restriction endonuclease McrA
MLQTLLLNSDYNPISVLPLSVVSWQRAVALYFLGRVQILENYPGKLIRSEKLVMEVPSVCVTKEYFNFKKNVKYSRANVFLRDLYQCQYCGETFAAGELTLDHVIPRSGGGRTVWDNTVTACKPCNLRKGSRLWKPMRTPFKPDYYSLITHWRNKPVHHIHPSWHKYIGLEESAINAA